MTSSDLDWAALYQKVTTDRRAADAESLLKQGFRNPTLTKTEQQKTAQLAENILREAPPFRLYQIARLYRRANDPIAAVRVLEPLAYENCFLSAQWMLGRMIIKREITGKDWDDGIALLQTAAENGHLRAPGSLYIARASSSRGLKKFGFGCLALLFGLRFHFYWRVKRQRGHHMQ